MSELGETLATNITAKGVSASASDGLTTLANKVLQITGGGGGGISLSTNKNILSYYDSDTATLTATYETGATMELYNASTNVKIGNFTESNGTYTYTYSANGTGDIYLKAKVGSTESTAILIEDCLFYGINTSAFTIPNDTTFSSDGTKITATTSTSSEKLVYFNHSFSSSDDFLFESELAQLSVTQGIAMNWNDVDYYGGQSNTNQGQAFVYFSSYTNVNHTFAVGDTYTVIKENGTTSAYVNDTLIDSTNASYKSTFKVGFYINRNRTQYYKNIKIKIVNGVTPPSPTPTSDCSQYQTEIANAITYINGSGS